MSDLPPTSVDAPASRRAASRDQMLGWLFVLGGLAVLAFGTTYTLYGDGFARFLALVERLGLEPVNPAQLQAVDAHKYPLIGPLGASPLYLLGRALNGAPDRWAAIYNGVLLALGIAGFWRLWRDRLPSHVLHRFLVLVLAGSLFCGQVQLFYGEVFTAVWLGLGLAMVVAATNAARPGVAAAGWGLAILGVANTPAAAVGLALAVLRRLWTTRRLRVLTVLLFAAAAILLERWWRLGSLQSGYDADQSILTVMPYSGHTGFSYPLFFGVIGILFSFGKGLVWFTPGLFLPLRRRLRPSGDLTVDAAELIRETWTLWLAVVLGLIVVYAKWWSWYGGWSWGPRFFVFASLPAALAVAVYLAVPSRRLWVNAALLAILGLSLWVGFCGYRVGLAGLDMAGPQGRYQLEHLTWYTPEFSVLWRPLVAPHSLTATDLGVLAYLGLAFLWLGWPCLNTLARQLSAASRALLTTVSRPGPDSDRWRW